MGTMNISLPDPMKSWVEDQAKSGRYANSSDYVRDLIRQRQRSKSEDLLRKLVAEGLASGTAELLEADHFNRMRERASL